MEGYVPILVLGLITALLIFATLFASRFLSPANPNARKRTTYESGEITQGSGRGPIPIQYYPYVLLFLILDVEILFLVPFAYALGDWLAAARAPAALINPGVILIELTLFVGTLLIGWYYALRKGALRWVR